MLRVSSTLEAAGLGEEAKVVREVQMPGGKVVIVGDGAIGKVSTLTVCDSKCVISTRCFACRHFCLPVSSKSLAKQMTGTMKLVSAAPYASGSD